MNAELSKDLLTFARDVYAWLYPVCDVNEETMAMLVRARGLLERSPEFSKHKCELEGDTDPCGLMATREVEFPKDWPGEWFKACEECIDRRRDLGEMRFRELGAG